MTDDQAEIQILKMQLALAHRFIDELVAALSTQHSGLRTLHYPEGKTYPEATAVPFPNKTLSIRDAAKYLRIHRSTFISLIRQGVIVAEKIGSRWQVEREALDRWRQHPTAAAPTLISANEAAD